MLLVGRHYYGPPRVGTRTLSSYFLDTGKVNADSNDRSALTSLGRDAFVRLLNRSELVADLKDNGLTPLSSAVKHGQAIAELVRDRGKVKADLNGNCRTPLSYAAARGNEAIVKLFGHCQS